MAQEGVDGVTLWKADKISIPSGGSKYPQQRLTHKSISTALPSTVQFRGAEIELNYPMPYQNAFLGTREVGFLYGGLSRGGSSTGLRDCVQSVPHYYWQPKQPFKYYHQVESWFDEFKKQVDNILMQRPINFLPTTTTQCRHLSISCISSLPQIR